MDSTHDEPLPVLLDLSHDEQGCAAYGYFHSCNFALARLIDEIDLDIFWVPFSRMIVCH